MIIIVINVKKNINRYDDSDGNNEEKNHHHDNNNIINNNNTDFTGTNKSTCMLAPASEFL